MVAQSLLFINIFLSNNDKNGLLLAYTSLPVIPSLRARILALTVQPAHLHIKSVRSMRHMIKTLRLQQATAQHDSLIAVVSINASRIDAAIGSDTHRTIDAATCRHN
jgi:hypothetical protein